MKRNKHTASTISHSSVSVIGIGVVSAVTLSTILSVLLTSIVINGSISESTAGIGIFAIRALSVLIASIVGTAIAKEKYLQTIGFITLGYFVILLALGIILYDGSFQNFGNGAISALIGGLAAYLIQMRPRKNRKHTARYNR